MASFNLSVWTSSIPRLLCAMALDGFRPIVARQRVSISRYMPLWRNDRTPSVASKRPATTGLRITPLVTGSPARILSELGFGLKCGDGPILLGLEYLLCSHVEDR